jgi:hypothetical protein
MQVIPVNRVVDKKRIIGNRGPRSGRGPLPQKREPLTHKVRLILVLGF